MTKNISYQPGGGLSGKKSGGRKQSCCEVAAEHFAFLLFAFEPFFFLLCLPPFVAVCSKLGEGQPGRLEAKDREAVGSDWKS